MLEVITTIVISLSQQQLCTSLGDCYPVSTGKPGYETPVGTFHILEMHVNPLPIDPFTGKMKKSRIFGTRNIVISAKFKHWNIGIHGSDNPNRPSHSCVRGRNKDIEYIFDRVIPETQIIIKH